MSGPDLVDHLVRTTPLDQATATRIVEEVTAFFREPVDSFVRRRHRELQRAGLTNRDIYDRIAAELADRPVAAPVLTERQIRRLVYG
ncbi:MAG: hypothetical protein JJE52_08750 [Acidimicrobiia bacterium]|nr:hypothetical protein [Acidimicrobiia bacterium]